MNYINQKLSAKLEKLGLKSESGMWWVWEWYKSVKFEGKKWHWNLTTQFDAGNEMNPPKRHKAHTLSDILNPDNLKKLFGDSENKHGGWKWCGQQLLKAHWESWDQLEKYLEGVL